MSRKKAKSVEGAQATDAEELEEMIEDAVDGGSWPVKKLKPVLEAVLFAAGDPLPMKRLTELVAGASRLEINTALKELQADYESRGVGLTEVAGGWQMRTAPEHQTVIKKLFKERPFRLTRAGMETLAIVAYRQPVTRAEVEAVRGVDCTGVLESMVERKVMKIAGRRDVPGRPLVYVTTPMFLEMFGLKDLKALPTLAELGDEFTNLAEHTGFSDSEERDATVLPFEEGEDGEGQEQTAGAQGDQAVERRADQEDSRQTDAQAHDNEGDDESAAELHANDETGDDDDGIPKIHFGRGNQSDQDDQDAYYELDDEDDEEDDEEPPRSVS